MSGQARAILDAIFPEPGRLCHQCEGGKEVPSMSEEQKMPETVDITALSDEELDDVVGGVGDAIVPQERA
jgi:hypothetical protein